MTTITYAYAALALLALIPSVGYAARYHLVTRGGWRRHLVGRALMYKGIVNALLIGFVAFNAFYVGIFHQTYFLRPFIGIGLFTLFTIVLWRLWYAFEKSQKED